MTKRKQTAIIFLFFIMIFGMSAFDLIMGDRAFSEHENRYLEKKPKFSFKKLVSGEFTEKYETYLTDQFFFRDNWIELKSLAWVSLLQKEVNGVYIASGGYLIERHTNEEVMSNQYEKNISDLIKFASKYENMKWDSFSIMPIPTADAILSDKLPPFANGFNQDEFLSNFKLMLEERNLQHTLIDVSDTLKEHSKENIYYKTDHHWTGLGAFYAYNQWIEDIGMTPLAISQWEKEVVTDEFLGTVYSKVHLPVKADEILLYHQKNEQKYQVTYNLGEKTTDTIYDKTKLDGKDKYAVYFGGNMGLVEIQTQNKNGRELLVVKDSYANAFIPFAMSHFEKVTVIDLRYFNMSLEKYINQNEFSDVLLLYNIPNMLQERNLTQLTR